MASIADFLVRTYRFFVRHPARILFILLLLLFILLSRIHILQPDRKGSAETELSSEVGTNKELHKSQKELDSKTNEAALLEEIQEWDEEKDSATEKQDKHKLTSKTNDDTEDREHNVLMTLVKVGVTSPLARSFRRCVNSICAHTSVAITFNVVVDDIGKLTTQDAFEFANKTCKQRFTVKYYSVEKVAAKVRSFTKVLQELFSIEQSYYNDPVFFLSVAIHYVLPHTMSKVIMLDSDLEFRSDIGKLFHHFSQFEVSNIFGLAREQQPVYRHVFHMYRQANPNTRVGEPPPDGMTGFNSGVLLIDLQRMRKSHIYSQVLTEGIAKEIAQHYEFQGHLGDQDFYTVINMKFSKLFYTLPCSWNRQLCTWWRDNGYSDVFQLYNNCSEPIHVYHGNCRTPIPEV